MWDRVASALHEQFGNPPVHKGFAEIYSGDMVDAVN